MYVCVYIYILYIYLNNNTIIFYLLNIFLIAFFSEDSSVYPIFGSKR